MSSSARSGKDSPFQEERTLDAESSVARNVTLFRTGGS